MLISDIMTTRLVTVEPDDSIAVIKEIFDHLKFHHVLVIEHKKLFGVVSDRDLLKALSPKIDTVAATAKDLDTLNKKTHQIMTRKPVTVTPNHKLDAAAELMLTRSVSCLPVVDEDGPPVGIVSWRDLLRGLMLQHRQER